MMPSSDTSLRAEHYEISNSTLLIEAPVVSVLMLAYNHGAYLAQAIESVLAQRADFSYELLIGEDCSTDETREIALRYQAANPSKIRFLSASRNVGMQKNARRLLEACRGEFAAMCEGDDFWNDPRKLQLQVDYLRQHPETGAIHSDFDRTLFRAGKWRTLQHFHKRTRNQVPQGDIFTALLGGNFIQTCTFCIRTRLIRDYIESELPKDDYPVGDWPLSLYVAGKSTIAYLPESLATYRKVPGSAMNSGHGEALRIAIRYRSMINDFCTFFGTIESLRTVALSSLHKTTLSLAFLANDTSEFEASWAWLKEHDPEVIHPFRRRLLRWILPKRRTRTLASIAIDLVRRGRELRLYRSIR